MHSILLLGLLVQSPGADSGYLYRTLLLRAAPGQLLAVIDVLKARLPMYDASGDGRPFILRHSQGDQWDLMVLYPMGSFASFYSPERIGRRRRAAEQSGTTEEAFEAQLGRLVAWHEEVFVAGPPIDEVRRIMDGGAFYHIEMFIALPGRLADLRRERDMENAFEMAFNRPQDLVFTRVAGAAWDLFSIGVYRDIKHFAESADIPQQRQDSAAKAAGFTSADAIGPYLRGLIGSHHDTLARAVR